MDRLKRQVRSAHRRLLVEQLSRVLTWTLLVGLIGAIVALAIPKIWPMAVDTRRWAIGWISGGAAFGVVAGCLWAWFHRRRSFDAALEIDRRFGLKERISSALALPPDQRDTAAGAALVDDAERRVRDLDVGEQFRPQIGWHPVLPLIAGVLAVAIAVFIPDAISRKAQASTNPHRSAQVKKSIAELRKRLQQQKKQATPEKLADAHELFAEFDKTLQELDRQNGDRKKTLVKLNDLSKKLNDQRDQLRDSARMRQQLQQLKGLQQGPAQRLAQSLKNGDVRSALDELKRLSEQLQKGGLSKEQQQQLAKQLQQMRDELQKALAARQQLEQKQRDLEKQIDKMQQQGNRAAAAKLQQQLEQVQKQLTKLDQQNPQLQKLQELAAQLQQCQNALSAGEAQAAAKALQQMAEQLQQMQAELDQLETLDQLMDEIAATKSAMNCSECNGQGCAACQGNGFSDQLATKPGPGMGRGRGKGDRPEEQTGTGKYKTRVGAKPRSGEAVRVGDADGPNVAGSSRAAIQKEMESAASEDPDPVVRQHLPSRQRAQTREYFEQFHQRK